MIKCLFISLMLSVFIQNNFNSSVNTVDTVNIAYLSEEEINISSRVFVAGNCEITVEISFNGNTTPPTYYYYTEIINNKTYSGSLKLVKYKSAKGKTLATYKGTLFPNS